MIRESDEKSTKCPHEPACSEEPKKFPLRRSDSQLSIVSEDGSEAGDHPVANRGDRRLFPTIKKWFFENNKNIDEADEEPVAMSANNNTYKTPPSPVLRARAREFRGMNVWMPQAM